MAQQSLKKSYTFCGEARDLTTMHSRPRLKAASNWSPRQPPPVRGPAKHGRLFMKEKLKSKMRSKVKMRNHIHVVNHRHDRRFDLPEHRSGIGRRSHALAALESIKIRRPATGQEILVPVAFSPACEYAVDVALDMARNMDCGILLVHVADRIYGHTFLDSELRELAQLRSIEAATQRLVNFADTKRRPETPIRCVVKTGLPSYEILRVAETENAKWIVMARTPRNVISRMVSGSVSGDIVDCSPCPVLIVNDFGRRRSK
jgi:nucleotide-binding universal stress UspA family protein